MWMFPSPFVTILRSHGWDNNDVLARLLTLRSSGIEVIMGLTLVRKEDDEPFVGRREAFATSIPLIQLIEDTVVSYAGFAELNTETSDKLIYRYVNVGSTVGCDIPVCGWSALSGWEDDGRLVSVDRGDRLTHDCRHLP